MDLNVQVVALHRNWFGNGAGLKSKDRDLTTLAWKEMYSPSSSVRWVRCEEVGEDSLFLGGLKQARLAWNHPVNGIGD